MVKSDKSKEIKALKKALSQEKRKELNFKGFRKDKGKRNEKEFSKDYHSSTPYSSSYHYIFWNGSDGTEKFSGIFKEPDYTSSIRGEHYYNSIIKGSPSLETRYKKLRIYKIQKEHYVSELFQNALLLIH